MLEGDKPSPKLKRTPGIGSRAKAWGGACVAQPPAARRRLLPPPAATSGLALPEDKSGNLERLLHPPQNAGRFPPSAPAVRQHAAWQAELLRASRAPFPPAAQLGCQQRQHATAALQCPHAAYLSGSRRRSRAGCPLRAGAKRRLRRPPQTGRSAGYPAHTASPAGHQGPAAALQRVHCMSRRR